MMTTEYVTLRPSMTVEESILRIRRTGVDKENHLHLLRHRQPDPAGPCNCKRPASGRGRRDTHPSHHADPCDLRFHLADQEEVARMFAKYNFLALPVVDNENRMVGIVTFDDAMDVMEEEATETTLRSWAACPPRKKTYSRATTWDLFKQRIPLAAAADGLRHLHWHDHYRF